MVNKSNKTDKTIEVNESRGIQFSLSFLIQILGTVTIAVWGYSQLDARISQGHNMSMVHDEKIKAIEEDIKENQDKPISSDHVQNTALASHERELLEVKNRLKILETRIYNRNID